MTEKEVFNVARRFITSEVARAWKKELGEFANYILEMRNEETDGDESVSDVSEE